MAPRPRATQSLESRRTRGIKSYRCRVCSGIHPLRKCKRFHKLSAEKRLRAVLINKYCSNCLAHQHSGGDCRSQDGCKKCGGDHHTLLHMHEVLPAPTPAALPAPTRRERHPAAPRPVRISGTPPPAPVANNRPRPKVSVASPSVATVQQKAVPILPTAVVVLDTGSKTFETGAMIDPCMPVSSIDRSLAAAFRLPITRLGDDEVCSVTLRSRTSTFRLNVVLKIEPSLRIRTPIRALSDAARAKFDGVRLANERFHRPASISLVLGSDVYANLIQPGFLKIEDGLPVAQNTVFGWTVSGACTE
ncbi:uncharacterized protein LOC120445537 [Drosophila santomea]|uniref:uncharacterized protein LOC120445537 n=1 Tax=Drosophila santomea TaxID=129105 RepID=UPI001954E259|nr:uncharacterized protein LOC120445537 [Drosophila santomea]